MSEWVGVMRGLVEGDSEVGAGFEPRCPAPKPCAHYYFPLSLSFFTWPKG